MTKSYLKQVLNSLYWIGTILLVVIAGLTLLTIFGGPKQYKLLVVQSGSMEPALKTGGLVLTKPETSYNPGDIITFRSDKNTVTHRVVNVQNTSNRMEYQTKGDANNTPDMKMVALENIYGKVIFFVPYLGYPVAFAKTQQGFILLIVFPAVIIVISELLNIQKEARKLIAERKQRKLSLTESVEEKVGEEILTVEKNLRAKKS